MNLENDFISDLSSLNLAIIGLGYVGLPLAVAFSKKRTVIGLDISSSRIEELKTGYDKTLEISEDELNEAKNLTFTNKSEEISEANIYIVTVPTPINIDNSPDLRPLIEATKTLGHILKKGNIVIYESTVYPGVTEEECVPVLETISDLKFNKDFFVGYSPERIKRPYFFLI